jgi:hypothetical protein
MRQKIEDIIELAKSLQFSEDQVSVLQASPAELHVLASRENALKLAVEDFLKEYDHATD